MAKTNVVRAANHDDFPGIGWEPSLTYSPLHMLGPLPSNTVVGPVMEMFLVEGLKVRSVREPLNE